MDFTGTMNELGRTGRFIPEELRAPQYGGKVVDDAQVTVSSPSAFVNERRPKRSPSDSFDRAATEQKESFETVDENAPASTQKQPLEAGPPINNAIAKIKPRIIAPTSTRDWDNSNDMYAPEEAAGSTESLQPSSIKEAASRLTDSKSTDWKLRLAAIEWLRVEVQTDAGKVNVTEHLVMLSNPLIAQIRDLRSAIVRETCAMIKLFAQILGSRFSVIAPDITKVLLTITGGGNKVIAGYCEDCAFEVVRKSESPNSFPILVSLCKPRSSRVREHAVACLALGLECWNPVNWLHHASVIGKGIKMGLEDSTPSTRNSARKGFGVLSDHAPDEAKKMAALLDKRTLARLNHGTAVGSSTLQRRSGHGSGGKSTRPPAHPSLDRLAVNTPDRRAAEDDRPLPSPPSKEVRNEWVKTQRIKGDPIYFWNSRTNEISWSPWIQVATSGNDMSEKKVFYYNVESNKTSWYRPEDHTASPRHVDTPTDRPLRPVGKAAGSILGNIRYKGSD